MNNDIQSIQTYLMNRGSINKDTCMKNTIILK